MDPLRTHKECQQVPSAKRWDMMRQVMFCMCEELKKQYPEGFLSVPPHDYLPHQVNALCFALLAPESEIENIWWEGISAALNKEDSHGNTERS